MWLLADIIDLNNDGKVEGMETFLTDLVLFGTVVAAVVAIIKGINSLKKTTDKMDAFFDDWYGESPRPGVEPRPGVLLRLHALEDDRMANSLTLGEIQNTVNEIQEQVHHELNRNGGGSTKDAAHEALRVANEIKAAQERYVADQALFRSQYLRSQEVTRAEWEAVFDTVRDMIGKPVEEQVMLWTKASGEFLDSTRLGEANG
jgi:hypothetical protein